MLFRLTNPSIKWESEAFRVLGGGGKVRIDGQISPPKNKKFNHAYNLKGNKNLLPKKNSKCHKK